MKGKTTVTVQIKDLAVSYTEDMEGTPPPPGLPAGAVPISLADLAGAVTREIIKAGTLSLREGKTLAGTAHVNGAARNGTAPATRNAPADQVARAAEAHGLDPDERLATVPPAKKPARARKANVKPRPKRGK